MVNKCKNHFPVFEKRWKGVTHLGIRGRWVGICKCGQVLEYVNNGIWHGWFTTEDKTLIQFIHNANYFESNIEKQKD